jgi:RNA polymerase sigma factor (sigma-70 family)
MTEAETVGVATVDADDRVRHALVADLDGGFVVLYETYQRLVFSTALRLCGRWADAEDLTAEAFLRSYRALAGYEPARIGSLQPRAWLATILLNVWRNSRRTAARRTQSAPLEAAPDPADPREDVERAVELGETGRELAGMLRQLPEQQRIAVVLRHVADLPITEIASVFGSPEGTVKSHISRGLQRLRELQAPAESGAPKPPRRINDPANSQGDA